MPKKTFAIQDGGPERLEIEWKGHWRDVWKDMTIRFDGVPVGSIADGKQLGEADNVFQLSDGSRVKVGLAKGVMGLGGGLEVTRNGAPVPGSGTDPRQLLKSAVGAISLIAGISLVVGLIGLFVESELLERLGGGWPAIVSGGIFAALGWSVWKTHSRTALGIAIALYLGDTVVWFGSSVVTSGQPGVGGIIFRVAMLMIMVRGFTAIREITDASTRPAPSSVFP